MLYVICLSGSFAVISNEIDWFFNPNIKSQSGKMNWDLVYKKFHELSAPGDQKNSHEFTLKALQMLSLSGFLRQLRETRITDRSYQPQDTSTHWFLSCKKDALVGTLLAYIFPTPLGGFGWSRVTQ